MSMNAKGKPESMPPKMRVELFFQSTQELTKRVQMLQSSYGIKAFNLVNKNQKDNVVEWVDNIHEACPDADICAHYSLKYNKVARKGVTEHAAKMNDFIQRANHATEVLLISGSGKKAPWNTVQALQHWPKDAAPKVAVAYNPYFPKKEDQELEEKRLKEKLDTNKVDKLYLQFGTDLEKLKGALDHLSQHSYKGDTPLEVSGSLFLPTKRLIAQQKFRPWNGVFLSPDFLSGPESATEIVVQMIRLYRKHNVELLWEAPGIRTDADMELAQDLIRKSQVDDSGHLTTSEESTEESQADQNDSNSKASGNLTTACSEKEPKKTKAPSVSTDANAKRRKVERRDDPCILLFGSHDVRLGDNKAFEEACRNHQIVIPAFIWTKQSTWGVRGALEVILKDALTSLDKKLCQNGMKLVCRDVSDDESSHTDELLQIIDETGAAAVYWNSQYTTESRAFDLERKETLKLKGVEAHETQSSLLYDPEKISMSGGFHGGHWGTLMPFLKNCKKNHGEPHRPTPSHETFRLLQEVSAPQKWPSGVPVDDLKLAVVKGNHKWTDPILERFPMSEESAHNMLDGFFRKGVKLYEKERSRTDKDGASSKLSAHLRIGTLSPNELYWRTEDCGLGYDKLKTFSRRLFWRDLAYYQLTCFPEMQQKSIREHYEKTKWIEGEEADRRLHAWKWGKTGFPIVDAGMRELYATGFMTQSVRMVVASFLVEYLHVNWVEGCKWFHYTLVDADSAINSMMWQNAGKCGIDQWNFVLSPETASQDPTGEYTRKWVPELAELPTIALVHRPWQATTEVLEKAGVVLGENYPHRIVTDLKKERNTSIENTLEMRRQSQYANNDRGYDLISLPNGNKTVVFTKKEYRIDSEGNRMKDIPSNSVRTKKSGTKNGRRNTTRRTVTK